MATATEVLNKLSGMIADWQKFLDEQIDWSAGTGTKPLTDSAGNTRQTKTPHELERLADAAVARADSAVDKVDGAIGSASVQAAAMTKAEFMALAEQRKRETAGSGQLKTGKTAAAEAVNQGLYGSTTVANTLTLGEGGEFLISGVVHKVEGDFKLPDAPNGTKTYDSATDEVVDFTKDTDPKYGDVAADTNEAVARAFEGMIKNGDFRDASIENCSLSASNHAKMKIIHGKLEITNLQNGANAQVNILIPSAPDDSFWDIEVVVDFIEGFALQHFTSSGVQSYIYKVGLNKFRLKAEGTIYLCRQGAAPTTSKAVISSYSVRLSTNKVITTRKDLCFLETWHEDITTSNWFNPLGNSQFGANTFDGIALRNDIPAQGYSAFGEWDTATKGFGKRWSTMTVVEKIKAMQNSDNNIYYDAETKKYIQVKYRIRVIEGLGDEWGTDLTAKKAYDALKSMGSWTVAAKGQRSSTDDFTSNATKPNDLDFDCYALGPTGPHAHSSYTQATTPLVSCWTNRKSVSGVGVSGEVYALPICTVQRLNQGAYHPVYNPEGCNMFRAATGWSVPWYAGTLSPHANPLNVKDCFDLTKIGAIGNVTDSLPVNSVMIMTRGSVESNYTGRTDQYKFYNAIYTGLVEDLRLPANKQDYSRLPEDGIRRAVAGKTRGKGKVPFTYWYDVYQINGGAVAGNIQIDANHMERPQSPIETLYGWNMATNKMVKLNQLAAYPHVLIAQHIDGSSGFSAGDKVMIAYYRTDKCTSEYDSLPITTVFGTPENIATACPNGICAEWNPSTTAPFSLNRKLKTGFKVLKTSDNGVIWVDTSFTVDEITNTVRFKFNAATDVAMFHYESLANFTEASNNSNVVGVVGKVVDISQNNIIYGNRLMPSLSGRIGKSSVDGSAPHWQTVLGGYYYSGESIGAGTGSPIHAPLTTRTPNNGSHGVKTLYTLTSKDGLLYMQYHGCELKYKADAASGKCKWGDTVAGTALLSPHGVIPVINGEGTKSDLNGQTVKTFCHHELIPIGIADNTQSAAAARTLELNFHRLEHVPTPLKTYYREDDVVTGYDTTYETVPDEVTGDEYQQAVQTPIMCKQLVRLPAYWENGGHIDAEQIEKWDAFQPLIDEHVQALKDEYESRIPEVLPADPVE